MGRRSCPSCGASLGIGSRTCEACGFDPEPHDTVREPAVSGVLATGAWVAGDPAAAGADPALVVAEDPAVPGDDAAFVAELDDGEVAFGRPRRRRRRARHAVRDDSAEGVLDDGSEDTPHRSRRAAVAVVAMVGGLALTAAVVGRGEDAGSRQALRDAATSTTTAPSTTTTAAPPTTRPITSFTDIRLGVPLSPVPTGGTVLYGLSVAGQVVRIDLDEGSVQSRRLRGPRGEAPGAGFRIVGRDGAALLADDEGNLLVVPDGDASAPDWRGGWGKVFPADRPDQVWRVTGDLSGDRQATLETVDGTAVGPVLAMPPGSVAQGTDGAGGMQYDNFGLRLRVTPAEAADVVEELASTPLLASNDAVLVRVACSQPGVCTWSAVARVSGEPIGSGVAPLALVVPGPPAVLSPDNRYLARISGRDGEASLTVLDLVSGTSRVLSGELQVDVAPVWTATGNQVLFLSDRGELYRLDAPTAEFEVVCGTCFRPLVALSAVAPAPPGGPAPPTVPTRPESADVTALLPASPVLAAP